MRRVHPEEAGHELGSQALPQRLPGDETLELADHLDMPAEGEIGGDALLERYEAELLEACDLRLCERLEDEVGER